MEKKSETLEIQKYLEPYRGAIARCYFEKKKWRGMQVKIQVIGGIKKAFLKSDAPSSRIFIPMLWLDNSQIGQAGRVQSVSGNQGVGPFVVAVSFQPKKKKKKAKNRARKKKICVFSGSKTRKTGSHRS